MHRKPERVLVQEPIALRRTVPPWEQKSQQKQRQDETGTDPWRRVPSWASIRPADGMCAVPLLPRQRKVPPRQSAARWGTGGCWYRKRRSHRTGRCCPLEDAGGTSLGAGGTCPAVRGTWAGARRRRQRPERPR
ncbi:hypothetical protein BC828DRAFT_36098 [Blastocladiella britannica]|nr:hypothetical protein BC828DRAFT_36098 [Blastocladiella britannica]